MCESTYKSGDTSWMRKGPGTVYVEQICGHLWHRYSMHSILCKRLVCFEIDSEGRLRTMISIFQLWTFHLYVAVFQQHLHMEYISLSWYDIPELLAHILDRRLLLTRKILNQGFLLVKLKSSLRKLYGRHHDFNYRYAISVSQMITDMFHLL